MLPAMLGLWVIAEMVVLSLVAFVAFGVDKRAAVRGKRRTPEKTLLVLSLLGGWPGVLIGRRVFRHKTRKQPFVALMWAAVAVHILGVAGVLWFFLPNA